MKFTKYEFKTGEEVFRWWIGEDPRQMRIEELLEGEES